MNQPDFYGFLKDKPSVFVVAGDRIFPLMIPQHVYAEASKQPCLVFQRTSGTRSVGFCGTDALVAGGFQLDSYARTYDAAQALADATRKELIDYAGPMGEVEVVATFLESDFDVGPEPDPGLYRVSMNFTLWYREQRQ